jgi:hypothetical protein
MDESQPTVMDRLSTLPPEILLQIFKPLYLAPSDSSTNLNTYDVVNSLLLPYQNINLYHSVNIRRRSPFLRFCKTIRSSTDSEQLGGMVNELSLSNSIDVEEYGSIPEVDMGKQYTMEENIRSLLSRLTQLKQLAILSASAAKSALSYYTIHEPPSITHLTLHLRDYLLLDPILPTFPLLLDLQLYLPSTVPDLFRIDRPAPSQSTAGLTTKQYNLNYLFMDANFISPNACLLLSQIDAESIKLEDGLHLYVAFTHLKNSTKLRNLDLTCGHRPMVVPLEDIPRRFPRVEKLSLAGDMEVMPDLFTTLFKPTSPLTSLTLGRGFDVMAVDLQTAFPRQPNGLEELIIEAYRDRSISGLVWHPHCDGEEMLDVIHIYRAAGVKVSGTGVENCERYYAAIAGHGGFDEETGRDYDDSEDD